MAAFGKFLKGATDYLLASADVDKLLALSPAVARRDLKTQSREEAHLRLMVGVLDGIARTGEGDKAERAAGLAEYIETLL